MSARVLSRRARSGRRIRQFPYFAALTRYPPRVHLTQKRRAFFLDIFRTLLTLDDFKHLRRRERAEVAANVLDAASLKRVPALYEEVNKIAARTKQMMRHEQVLIRNIRSDLTRW